MNFVQKFSNSIINKNEAMDLDKDKKGAKKLASYAVILILMIVIVIIIAAMADDRERTFQTQIDQTSRANMTIQDEIVALKDENYNLKQQLDQIKPKADSADKILNQLSVLNEALSLYNTDKAEEALAKYAEIDSSSVPESLTELYNTIGSTLGIEK